MTPVSLERVFGTSRLKMVTGQYAEVYREASAPGERRRYTKRFLATPEGDFREWTGREWRTLARLVGHDACHVPDVVQYDRGASGGQALVQTYDAGVTVDHWATLLPVERDGRVQRHIFQDCAHWWALARHLLLALHEIHPLRLVHLDLKADNICIPLAPADFDPADRGRRLFPAFENIALIDFAFSVVTGEALASPLPIGWQRTFRYQSPRLLTALIAGQKGDLEPTRQLDWRCDMYSLAALLEALLPLPAELGGTARTRGWTDDLYVEARSLVRRVRESHDGDALVPLPHPALAAACAVQLESPALSRSLQQGWMLAGSLSGDDTAGEGTTPTAPITRVTLIEPRSAFTAVTEALPPHDGRAADLGADSPFGPLAATQPLAEPTVPIAADVRDDAIPRAAEQPSVLSEPAPAVQSAPTDPPAPIAAPVPALPIERAGRDASGRRRTATAVLFIVLSFIGAGTWWLMRDTNSPEGDHLARDGLGTSGDVVVSPPGLGPATPAPEPGSAPAAARPASAPPSPLPSAQRSPPVVPLPSPLPSQSQSKPDPVPAQQSQTQPPSRLPQPQATPSSTDALPSVVARAEPRVAAVLSMASQARNADDDRSTAAAAASVGDGAFAGAGSSVATKNTGLARTFNAAAQRAFYQERNVDRAYDLQRQAFDADPSSVEIAGNLSFYALKLDPPRAEESRGLAIYALALSTRNRSASRSEDWGNLAVASALSGRSNDARSAMLVLLSVSRDVNRSCRSAVSSVASHGQAMRMPAEALLRRAQDRADVARAPECQWPPRWRRA